MDRRRLSASFERLDPVDRAILELSKRRGMTDEEIADVTRSTPASVTRRRRQSVDRIAVWMGAADADDRRGVDRDLDRLLASDGATSSARSGAATSTATEPAGRRGGWIVALVVVIALAVLGAAIGIGLSRAGQGTAEGPGPPVATPAPAGSGSAPRDGNANHSGRSLLRVPTAQLLSTS